MEPAAHAFRKIQLRTDVDQTRPRVLTFSGGDAFRVRQTASPGPNDVPLLVVGQSLDHDPNGTGFPLSTKIAAGMDPAATPAEATIPLDNLESLKLFDGFRCDFTNAPRVVYSRTFDIDRDGGWQQYFLSSAPDKAGAWKLDGMVLEWSDSTGGSGTATASPRDDSFRIPVSTNSPSQLTLSLRTTSTNAVCPQPLYLLTWSPGISISGATQAVVDGVLCQAVEWEGGEASVDILYDLSNRPCKADPFAPELAALLNPLPGDSRLVFTPDGSHTGGSLTAKAPGAYAMPWTIIASGAGASISMPTSELVPMKAAAAGEGGGACLLLFFDPFMTYGDGHCGGCGSTLVFDTATGTYVASFDYPLDSRCLWDNWRRDSSGAYPCTCQAEIFYGDDSLAAYFTENITPDGPHAIGTILFGGNPVWSGEATHHVADDCHDPFSDECDGCSSGCADGNCDALEGEALGSLAFRIPLGMPRDAQISGFLWFKATESVTITPSLFNLLIRDDANVVAVTNNGLRNVTCSDVRSRTAVIDDIPGGVRITLSKTADNSLEHTWEIVNVDDDPEEIQLTKISRLDQRDEQGHLRLRGRRMDALRQHLAFLRAGDRRRPSQRPGKRLPIRNAHRTRRRRRVAVRNHRHLASLRRREERSPARSLPSS